MVTMALIMAAVVVMATPMATVIVVAIQRRDFLVPYKSPHSLSVGRRSLQGWAGSYGIYGICCVLASLGNKSTWASVLRSLVDQLSGQFP